MTEEVHIVFYHDAILKVFRHYADAHNYMLDEQERRTEDPEVYIDSFKVEEEY